MASQPKSQPGMLKPTETQYLVSHPNTRSGKSLVSHETTLDRVVESGSVSHEAMCLEMLDEAPFHVKHRGSYR